MQLSGSAGEFMARDLSAQSGLELFVPDLCRTVLLQHTASGARDGLAYHKYELTESSFDNCEYDKSLHYNTLIMIILLTEGSLVGIYLSGVKFILNT